MAGYTRVDTINNIADGNVINAADLDGEFDGIQSAFNSSTGHNHDGTAGEGAPILALGPAQDVTISASVLGVKTTNTVDLGTSSLKFKDFYLAGTASIGGTLGVTGATTLSAALTYGGVTLSNAVTGTGNMVLSASPTLTGTITAAAANFSGAVVLNGNTTIGDADTDTITQAASYVTGTQLKSAKTATNTLNLAAYDVDGTAYTNLITLTASNTPTLALTSTGVGTINNMSIGATTAAAGTFTSLSDSGNLTFTGTGNRITGDMSNATQANRLAFQTSTANSATAITAIPNGTGTQSSINLFNNSDPTNASLLNMFTNATDARINSTITGTGTYLPMAFYTSGSEKLRIAADTTGTYTFGGTSPRITGDMSTGGASISNRVFFQTSTTNGTTSLGVIPNGTSTGGAIRTYNNSDPTNSALIGLVSSATDMQLNSAIVGTGTYLPMTFYTGGSERVRIDTSGNVGIGLSANASLKLQVAAATNITLGIANATTITGAVTLEAVNNARSNNIPMELRATKFDFTGPTSSVSIDTSGNVGIGTSSPATKLHVLTANPTAANEVARFQGGSNSANFRNYISLYTTNPSYWWELSNQDSSGTGATNGFAFIENSGGVSNTRMYMASGGNVGIGTTSPRAVAGYTSLGINNTTGSLLDMNVNGTRTTSLTVISTETQFGTITATPLAFWSNNAERMRIDSSGRVGIGSSSPNTSATLTLKQAASAYQIQLEQSNVATAGYGLRCDGGDGDLTFSRYETSAYTERMRLTSAGNLGIGTSSPTTYANGYGPVLVAGTNVNFATIQGRGDGPTGLSNGVSYGGSYSTNPINGSRMTLNAEGGSGQRGSVSFWTKDLDDNTTQPLERMRITTAGNVLVTSAAGLGYGTGSGGTVTQGTSRTTGVTLSKPTGAITMFSAAGSAIAATFTVTNTLVAATDTIILNQKSGTNLYVLLVTAVAAGSFNITFYTTGGVATDAPVINFSLIKGVTA